MSSVTILSRLPIGARARVVSVSGDPDLERRLLALGVLPGVELSLVRVAPLGDPIQIELLGYNLSLRKSEAACVRVEEQS